MSGRFPSSSNSSAFPAQPSRVPNVEKKSLTKNTKRKGIYAIESALLMSSLKAMGIIDGGMEIRYSGTPVSPIGMPIMVPAAMAIIIPAFHPLTVKTRIRTRVMVNSPTSPFITSPRARKPEPDNATSLTLHKPVAAMKMPTTAPRVIFSPLGTMSMIFSLMPHTVISTKIIPDMKLIPNAVCQVAAPEATMENANSPLVPMAVARAKGILQ